MAKISVIVPVYNVGRYLKTSIDSVVAQDIGFTENIELILVDDGSTDDSGKICQHYASEHPLNIRYIQQKNAGVSRARNAGLAVAQGEYVHFFDGDDVISKDFYRKSIEFLEAHSDVDFVASKLMFFDAVIDSHPLNDKFVRMRVIDVSTEPDNPLMHVVSCVFRRAALESHSFDEQLAIAEDAKFISDILVDKKRYGVLSDTVYHYRKRGDDSSAIGGKESKPHYYLDVPHRSYQQMLDVWSTHDSLWAEYVLLYDISYRLKQKNQSVLSQKEVAQYKTLIREILASCSNETIASNRFLTIHQKLYALEAKYGDELSTKLETKNDTTTIDGHVLHRHQSAEIHLDFLAEKSDGLYEAEGYVKGPVKNVPVEYCLRVGEKEYALQYVPRAQREESFLGDVYNDGGAFAVSFAFPAGSTLCFVAKVASSKARQMTLHTGPFTRFGALKLTYRLDGDRLIKRTTQALSSQPYTRLAHVKLEARMLVQILLNWRFGTAKIQLRKLRSRNLAHLSTKAKLFEIAKPALFVAEALYTIPRALMLRIVYYGAKKRQKRPIWIVSDRGMAAGDNGEALFRHVMAQPDCPADVYFAISNKSEDYARMTSIGPVLNHGSLRHKLMHLLSDKIISSQADIETTNPFIRQFDHYVDLMNFDFVFLQHGVIRHDLSEWLNRFNKNIHIFVTSAQKEYDSILGNPYYYTAENILLSGLPRFDYLESSPNKKLILAPTYRKNLAKQKTDINGIRKYDPTFKDTEYFNFYNDFMNDTRLVAALEKADMVGEFYLHPAFATQRTDFNENDRFKVMKFPYDYKKAFKEGELLVSDHSSVVFDFAYLKKPVLYAYFDIDTFFDGHSYDKSSFFSDLDDGFGQVCQDYDELVNAAVKIVESRAEMSDKYKKRVYEFFYKVDKRNSSRVYQAILERN